MSNRCVIFDLDGTLIDSREDIAGAVNMLRESLGLPPLSLETVVSYIGDGAKKLVDRALAGENVNLPDAYKKMGECYRANLTNKTTAYPGVFEGVGALKEAGWELALISNKPTELCRLLLNHFKIGFAFSHIIGGGDEFPLKPDPAALNFVLERTKSEAAKSWVVGDNHTDLEAGTRAGMKRCYAAYGFGDPLDKDYDLKVGTFDEFIAVLLKEES
jgi:phosphoglycolate phosphatase